jgi:hypothetical protein
MKNRIFTVLFCLVLFLSNPFSIAAQAIVDNVQAQSAPAIEPPVAQDAPATASDTPAQAAPSARPSAAQDAPLSQDNAPQPPQSPAQLDSLAALDAEAARFSALVGQALAALPPDTRVMLGSFQLKSELSEWGWLMGLLTLLSSLAELDEFDELSQLDELDQLGEFDDVDSLFGTYWNRQLSSNLSKLENRRFLIITSDQAEADYTLDGLILLIEDTLRIYTQLIRVQDAALMDTWVTDFVVTPFIQTLLPGPGFAGPSTSTPSYSSSKVAPDEYEPDSMENPVFIECDGYWLERTFHDGYEYEGDEDWFMVIPDEDGTLILETAGDVDTYVTLFDAETGFTLTHDDDSGEYYNAYLEYEVEAGKRYIIQVWSFGDETGVYQFRASIEETPASASIEPNNSMDEATFIEVGEKVSGYFESSSDVDWYAVNAEAGAYLTIYTSGSMDTFITAYDQAGNKLAFDDDSYSGNNAWLMLTVPSDGVVYAEISEYDGARGTYTLWTELVEVGEIDAYEPDNDPCIAKEITLGETQNRTFTIAEDADYVRFTISEKSLYEIRTIAAGDYLDSYIGLYHYDDAGEYIAEDDDSGNNYDACLRVELEAGEYCLEIYCMSDNPLSNNAYTLSLMLVTEDDLD